MRSYWSTVQRHEGIVQLNDIDDYLNECPHQLGELGSTGVAVDRVMDGLSHRRPIAVDNQLIIDGNVMASAADHEFQ
jgi:hypothetical protein